MKSTTLARRIGRRFLILIAGTIFVGTAGGSAVTETVLYSFESNPDGAYPYAGLITDRRGNLYGTTLGGGSCCGTVFELSPPSLPGGAWTEQVLYTFQGKNDGAAPMAALIIDGAGNLYGTTSEGGSGTSCSENCGVIFGLAPPAQPQGAWRFRVLYAFQGGSDGASPTTSPLRDSAGNLYGTTPYGGGVGHCSDGCGTVFELSPPSLPGGDWVEAVLYRFQGWPDGYLPMSGLVSDAQGNLYGTTANGGRIGGNLYCLGGCGTVFELIAPLPGGVWTKTELYRFGGSDGVHPSGNLVFDELGNLYGTTRAGGTPGCRQRNDGCGNVYELSPPGQPDGDWTATSLYAFGGQESGDGRNPMSGVIRDGLGSLYGTASGGESIRGNPGGVVFRLTPKPGGGYNKTMLPLGLVSNGAYGPEGGLIFGPDKSLIGTGAGGGSDSQGAVFSIGQ